MLHRSGAPDPRRTVISSQGSMTRAMVVLAAAILLCGCRAGLSNRAEASNGKYTASVTKVETVESLGQIKPADSSKVMLLVHLKTDDPSLLGDPKHKIFSVLDPSQPRLHLELYRPEPCGSIGSASGDSKAASDLWVIDNQSVCGFYVDRGNPKFTTLSLKGYPQVNLPKY